MGRKTLRQDLSGVRSEFFVLKREKWGQEVPDILYIGDEKGAVVFPLLRWRNMDRAMKIPS